MTIFMERFLIGEIRNPKLEIRNPKKKKGPERGRLARC